MSFKSLSWEVTKSKSEVLDFLKKTGVGSVHELETVQRAPTNILSSIKPNSNPRLSTLLFFKFFS